MVDITFRYWIDEPSLLRPILRELTTVNLNSKFSFEIRKGNPTGHLIDVHFITTLDLPLEWYKRLFLHQTMHGYQLGVYHDDEPIKYLLREAVYG
jgi:hypothetical protein